MKRVILLIIDSLGIGYMEDVAEGREQDIGANTLKHVIENNPHIKLENLEKLGIMNALGIEIGKMKFRENTTFGSAKLAHLGADSFFGHNEIIGTRIEDVIELPFSAYIDTIYKRLIKEGYIVNYCGRDLKYLIVNEEIIIADNIEAELGNVYSVVGSLNKNEFKDICKVACIVREIVKVSRVVSVGCNIEITELIQSIDEKESCCIGINAAKCNLYNRGYKVEHKGYGIGNKENVIDRISGRDLEVTLIGKAADVMESEKAKKIYGIDTHFIMRELLQEMNLIKGGVIIANIQETDSAGHLQNTRMYGEILEIVDEYIGEIIDKIKDEDILIITGDHGNDPTIGHSKHTREKVPVLIYGINVDCGFIGEWNTLGEIGIYIEKYLSRNF